MPKEYTLPSKHALPRWALHTAGPGDREEAARAHRRGILRTNWDFHPEVAGINYAGRLRIPGPPRDWAKARGWPVPWWGSRFKRAFLARMLESDEAFDLAVRESGVELYFPVREFTLPAEELAKLDAMYHKTEDMGALGRRPAEWGSLVAALRELRHLIEAGIEVEVEGETLSDWGTFYNWAHGRYHALEDGYDEWIGMD